MSERWTIWRALREDGSITGPWTLGEPPGDAPPNWRHEVVDVVPAKGHLQVGVEAGVVADDDKLGRAAELAIRLARKHPAKISKDDWAELSALMSGAVKALDTDDLCTCGHVRHEHHTWNEIASVGCAFCGCEQFTLLRDLTTEGGEGS